MAKAEIDAEGEDFVLSGITSILYLLCTAEWLQRRTGVIGGTFSENEDSGMVFVVVLHLSPEHESAMPALLQRHTPMQVEQAENGTKVEANFVYGSDKN